MNLKFVLVLGPPLAVLFLANWLLWRKCKFTVHITDCVALMLGLTPCGVLLSLGGAPTTPIDYLILVCLHVYLLAAMGLGKGLVVQDNNQRFLSFFCILFGSALGCGTLFIWTIFIVYITGIPGV